MKYVFLASAFFAIGYVLPTITVTVELLLLIAFVLSSLLFGVYYVDTHFALTEQREE